MKRFWFFFLSLLFFLAACTPKATVAHNLSFNINRGGQILVTLVRPKGNGPSAGISCKHWLRPVPWGRPKYLSEALTVASQGEVSLLPQVYFFWSSVSSGSQNELAWLTGKDQVAQGVRILVDPSRLITGAAGICWDHSWWYPQRHPGGGANGQGSLTYCGKSDPCKLDFTLGPHFQLPMA